MHCLLNRKINSHVIHLVVTFNKFKTFFKPGFGIYALYIKFTSIAHAVTFIV